MLFWKTWSAGQRAVCSVSIQGCCSKVDFKKGCEVHPDSCPGGAWPERNAESLLPTESAVVIVLPYIEQFR